MTWLDRVDPGGVDLQVPSTKCLWLRAKALYRVRVLDGRKRGAGGRGKEEDICNTNRFLSLTLTIGLQEHQEQHVC